MKLSEIGEREFLKNIFPLLDKHELYGDDDAVAYKLGDTFMIINVDTLVKSTDVLPNMSPEQIGNKIVVMTLSDIIAKGSKPAFFIVSLSDRGDTDVEYLMLIEKSIKKSCKKYGIKFFGGDLNESKELTITGVGVGFSKSIIPRKGAQIGDSVWTTGFFGLTGAAFHFLFSKGKPLPNMDNILESVYNPSLKIFDGSILQDVASASMDSSDGLAVTLNTIAEINNVKIVLDNIPLHDDALSYANVNGIEPVNLALYAGEEYEIIFTSPLEDADVLNKFRNAKLPEPIKIGHVEKGAGVEYENTKIEFKGWEHFKSGW